MKRYASEADLDDSELRNPLCSSFSQYRCGVTGTRDTAKRLRQGGQTESGSGSEPGSDSEDATVADEERMSVGGKNPHLGMQSTDDRG